MSRVISKNLFNFKLTGLVAEDLLKAESKMMADPEKAKGVHAMMKVGELAANQDLDNKHDDESNKEFVIEFRAMVDVAIKDPVMGLNGSHLILINAANDCTESTLKVPTSHDGDYDVLVEVYTPKSVMENKHNAALVYAHGGGAVGCSASDYKPHMMHRAVDCGIIVFNVDYRLAPETKCPNNVKDFYAAIKYVAQNALDLGVDVGKIAIAGDSGGGYICLGAMVMLAQNNEAELVKLAIPEIPMACGDYLFSDPLAMTQDEREACYMMRKLWRLIAADIDKQNDDPLLFPGKASDELLTKMPPAIILEVEFDMFITEATRMANKLRAAGRLLEFIVIPGYRHGTEMNPEFNGFKITTNAIKLALKEYLHN